MIATYNFYKRDNENWYINLPEYLDAGGQIEDLEMVAGADTMLDIIAGFNHQVHLKISDTVVLRNKLDFIEETDGAGANYRLDVYNDKVLNMPVWLCNVVLFIWPEFPRVIFFEQTYHH